MTATDRDGFTAGSSTPRRGVPREPPPTAAPSGIYPVEAAAGPTARARSTADLTASP